MGSTADTALANAATAQATADDAMTAIGGISSYSGFDISADGGVTSEAIASGGSVLFEAGSNVEASRSGNAITYGVVDAPTFSGLLTANGGFSVGAAQAVHLGNNVVQGVGDGIAATDGVNKGQLDVVGATADTALANAATAQATADEAMTAIGGINSYSGWTLSANGDGGEHIGSGESVDFAASDANGNLSVTRSGNTISYGFSSAPTFLGMTVGGSGGHFTIVNNTTVNMGDNVVAGVADGVAASDAANVGQLNMVSGDAAAAQATADSALAAAGTAQGTADQAVADAAIAQGTADQAVADAATAQGTANQALTNAARAQATADTAVVKADAAQATADTAVIKADAAQATADMAIVKADTAQATADTALTAAASALTDANAYADAGDVATLSASRAHADAAAAGTLTAANTYTDTASANAVRSANSYTDQRFSAWDDTFTQYQQAVDQRFHATDRRINIIGAMGGAMSAAAMNTAGLSGENRVGIGVGSQGGESALAVGYQRALGSRASFSLGGSFSGGEKSVNAGAGFSW